MVSTSKGNVGRILLAGPGAAVAALAAFAAAPTWLPKGAAAIDHLVIPLIALPGIWAAAFFYVLLERRLLRASGVLLSITVLNAVLLIRHFHLLP